MSDDKNVEITSGFDDRVTYWESRQINIGHYESRQFGITYARNINNKDKTISIRGRIETPITELESSIGFVQKALDREETKIRKITDRFTDFDSLDKIPDPVEREDAKEERASRAIKNAEGSERLRRRLESQNGRSPRSRESFLDE